MYFFVCYKKVLQKQSAKIDLKGKSCDEIDDDVKIHIIVNLGQKYEGDLGY